MNKSAWKKDSLFIDALAHILAILIVITVILFGLWLVWLLWITVLPALYPTGPKSLLVPSYWTFSGALVLIRLLWRGVHK